VPEPRRLLELLSDGRFHSGEELGERLRISRTAVWKGLKSLEHFDIEIHAVPGRGYRLARPLELLEGEVIRREMTSRGRRLLRALALHLEVDSTNSWLLRQGEGERGVACLSEYQSAGRGRRGRRWVSPFASNLYLSVGWRFDCGGEALTGLSLAVGVALIRALRPHLPSGLALKWPNDLTWEGRKAGGVLVEMSGESGGPCRVVVGVGLNFAMPAAAGESVDQPWADLAFLAPELGRNRLAGAVLDEILQALELFEQRGFSPFHAEWSAADGLADCPVALHLPDEVMAGVARGIDRDGALLLDTRSGRQRFLYGEVSLRPVEAASA